MSNTLPENANLDYLKGQAKALLSSLKSGDPEALARAQALGFSAPFVLANAQSIVAKEHGFPNWTRLKRHLEDERPLQDRLYRALKAGDRAEVAEVLRLDRGLANRPLRQDFEATPLNIAASRSDRPMIDLLLEFGADLNGVSSWWAGGFGPLDLAPEAICEYLLERGATLTPHAAARLGKVQELKTMLAKDPSLVQRRGGDGQFPLHFAKTAEIVDILVDAGADLESRDLDHEGTALQWRVLDEPVRKQLLKRGAEPDIFTAVLEDDPKMLARLLEADPAAMDRRSTDPGNPRIPSAPGGHIYTYTIGSVQPFRLAIDRRRLQAYEELWERARPLKRLTMLAWAGDREAARALAKQIPGLASQLSEADASMLPDAAWERQVGTVKLMLELGWPVDAVQGEQSSAVDRAAFHGFDDVIEAVLPYRPDLTRRNVYGGMPIGACCYGSLHSWRKDGNHARCVGLLLEAGSPVPERVVGSPEVLKMIERRGADG